MEVFYMLIVSSSVDITIKNNDGDTAFDIIEIHAADLFDLVFKHKKFLVEKRIETFQSLLKLKNAKLISDKHCLGDVSDLVTGIDKFLLTLEETNQKNSKNPDGCLLIDSSAIPYKRKFLHLFRNGKPLSKTLNDKPESKCPFGFGSVSKEDDTPAIEEPEHYSISLGLCPITGHSGSIPKGHTPRQNIFRNENSKGFVHEDGFSSKEESDADATSVQMGVCPITGHSGHIPKGHAPMQQTFPDKNMNVVGELATKNVIAPTSSPSYPSAGINLKQTIENAKSDIPTTCPFSPNYVPNQENDRLPECSQQ